MMLLHIGGLYENPVQFFDIGWKLGFTRRGVAEPQHIGDDVPVLFRRKPPRIVFGHRPLDECVQVANSPVDPVVLHEPRGAPLVEGVAFETVHQGG